MLAEAATYPARARALHVVQSLDARNGGTSVSVPALAAAVADDGRYENAVMHFGEKPQNGGIPSNVTSVHQPASDFALLLPTTARRALATVVRQSNVVHVHGVWTPHSLATIRIAGKAGIPVVVSAHGMLDEWALNHKRWKKGPYAAMFERPNLRRATCLRALTTVEVENYRDFGLSAPVAVIPNGVSAPADASADEFLARYPVLAGQAIVLFMGRLHKKKGVHLLVEAWREVHQRLPQAHLLLAGPDDGGLGQLSTEARALLTGSSVTTTGLLTGSMKWSALAASSLFVLPSFSEGLSMATLEALWQGVPIVITKGCNFREAEALECTFLVEPEVRSIAAGLCHALSEDAATLKQRGQAGACFVREHYSWHRVGEQMADVYDWLRGGTLRPAPVFICSR